MSFIDMFSKKSESSGGNKYLVRQDARAKYISGKQPLVFNILPAFDPSNPDKSTSWYPSILPDGSVSAWANGFNVARGLGHGDWKSRYDIVTLEQFGDYCPLSEVYKAARADKETWGYLLEDKGKWGDQDRVPAALPRIQTLLVANVYFPAEPEKLAQVGIFNKTLAKKLISPETGLLFAPDPKATDEQVAADYLAAYANGDITDPNSCPLFCVEKGTDKGEMSGYDIRFQLGMDRRVQRRAITTDILASRYDMNDLRSFITVLTTEGQLELILEALNGRSPQGYHEWALIRSAVGDKMKVPEPPSAPGVMSTIQSGFESPDPTPGPAIQQPSDRIIPPPGKIMLAPASHVMTMVADDPDQAMAPSASPAQPARTAAPELAPVMAAAANAGAVKQAPAVPGGAIPKFDKSAFLAGIK